MLSQKHSPTYLSFYSAALTEIMFVLQNQKKKKNTYFNIFSVLFIFWTLESMEFFKIKKSVETNLKKPSSTTNMTLLHFNENLSIYHGRTLNEFKIHPNCNLVFVINFNNEFM